MADLFFNGVKGGGFGFKSNAGPCATGNCGPCSTELEVMPRKVQNHDHPSYLPNWASYAPHVSVNDRDCVAVDEVPGASFAQVPADYVLRLVYVPAHSILKGIGVTQTLADDYGMCNSGSLGVTNGTLAGLTYAVEAYEVDNSVCPPAVGAANVADAVPAELASIVAATADTVVAPVSPATGGYVTGANGLMLAIKILTPPTNNPLSQIQATLTLQANIETFHALVR